MPILQMRKQRLKEGMQFVQSWSPKPRPQPLPEKLAFPKHLDTKHTDARPCSISMTTVATGPSIAATL